MKKIIHLLQTRVQPHAQSGVLLFLRITIGWSFFLTGKGKLEHFERTRSFFEGLNIPAPGFHAGLVGGTEMIGGLLLLVGLGTRVAYLTAHREGFASISDFTDQAPFIYLCIALVTLVFGAGKYSLDALIALAWNQRSAARASIK